MLFFFHKKTKHSLFDNAGYRIRKTEVLMWTSVTQTVARPTHPKKITLACLCSIQVTKRFDLQTVFFITISESNA